MTIRIPTMSPRSRSWPKHDTGGRALYRELGDALTRRYPRDEHFAAYCVPSVERRLAGDAPERLPGGVPMVLFVVDVDGAGHAASPEWRATEQAKVDALLAAHRGLVVYWTRGGYRVVGELTTPFTIASKVDARTWAGRYLLWLAYLSRVFDIVGDPQCQDWTRLYRLPHATRDEGGKPEDLPVLGDVHAVGAWTCTPIDADEREAKRLAERARAVREQHRRARYAEKAIADEVELVRNAPEGERNATLNTAALKLGQLVAGGALDRASVVAALEAAAREAGLADSEIAATIASGLEAGAREPRHVPTAPATERASTSAFAVGDHRCTDLANSKRLVAAHGGGIRYVAKWNRWAAWTGHRWEVGADGAVMRLATGISKLIDAEVLAIDDDDTKAAMRKWATKSEGADRIAAAVKLARVHAAIEVQPEVFDRDPWLLNTLSGTIDLRSGELRPHRREDLITRVAPVRYDPMATCPLWERFLEDILPSAELRAFTWRALGYALTGVTTEHKLFLAHGKGRNGKTVLLETVKAVLGDYAQTAAKETFTSSRDGDKIPNDLAATVGVRLLTVSETQEDRRLDEPMVKAVTGGDEVRARFMRAEWFTFKPSFKPWLATNHRPRVAGTDLGIWSRLCLIPFAVTIPAEKRDQRLTEKLRGEYAGILAWLVRGCLAWQRDGLGSAGEVDAATAAYQGEQDRVAAFIEDVCIVAPTAWVARAELRSRYEAWCAENDEKALTTKTFHARLRAKGAVDEQETTGERRRGWRGIGLTAGEQVGTADSGFSSTRDTDLNKPETGVPTCSACRQEALLGPRGLCSACHHGVA